MKKLFIYDPINPLREGVLDLACKYIADQGRKVHIVVMDPLKSREQEERYHAMIGDIAKQTTLFGKELPSESWKRLLIDAFKWETKNDPDFAGEWMKFGSTELAPALNHAGFVMIGEQSRNFSVKLAKGFIDWLEAYGAENDVVWSDRHDR